MKNRRGRLVPHGPIGVVGFLTGISLLLPFLGRTFLFSVGIHPRWLSYVALILIVTMVWNIRGLRAHRTASRDVIHMHMAVGALVVFALVMFPWGEEFWVTADAPSLAQYPGEKITDFILVSVPFIALAWVVHPYARKPDFVNGLAAASMFVGAIGLWEVFSFRDIVGNFDEFASVGFGTISLSMVLLFAIIGAAHWLRTEPTATRFYWFLALSAACLWSIFLVAQRTSMLLGLAFVLFMTSRFIIRRRTILISLAIIVALAATAGTLVKGLDGFQAGDDLPRQTARFTSVFTSQDTSTNARLEMWAFSWEAWFQQPFGRGFGSFAEEFPDLKFPHNIPVEAFYELGFVGGIAALYLIGLTVRAIVRLGRTAGAELYLLALVTALAMVLKAEDFASMGFWLFWLAMGTSVVEEQSRRTIQTSALGKTERTPQDDYLPLAVRLGRWR